jgi:hypothetical protein
MESVQHMRLPGERHLVKRLDVFLMTFGCISQGKSDRQNILQVILLTARYSHQVRYTPML